MKDKKDWPQLDAEAAPLALDPWNTVFMGILQPNDPLLLERGKGGSLAHELYRDLKRDGKVFSGLQKRKLAVVSRPWSVEPVQASEAGGRDAALVMDILNGFAFDRLCVDLLDALLMGWQPAEIVWTLREVGGRQMVVPERAPKRLHRRFVYVQGEAGGPPELRLLVREAMQQGVPVPERKFIVHRINAEDDNPYGVGLGLQLYWPVFFKRKGVLAWGKLCDRFGSPTPWGKYPREAKAREKGTLFEALRAMSNDGFIMTPEGVDITLLEARISSGGMTPNQSLVEYMDDWIMEVLLGQPPRGQSGGALAAAANEREAVRLELSQADSDLLSDTLNATLIRWICEFNGLQPCMVSRTIKAAEDIKAASETDANVAAMGFRMTLDGVRARYGEHWELAPNQPTLPASAAGGVPRSFAEGQVAVGRDALDELVDEELAQWREALEPMATPLRRLMARASQEGWTAGQLLDALPGVLPEMDADALAQALTRAAFAARGAARAGLDDE